MIFQHTWSKVLDGSKTQTRRIALPHADGTGEFDCEMIGYPMGIMSVQRLKVGASSWRTIYQVGKTYAVQPGRTKPAAARIRITGIRREDVREISWEDTYAEGFKSRAMFFNTWLQMHDKTVYEVFRDYKFPYGKIGSATELLESRPAERYQAWALTFELVK